MRLRMPASVDLRARRLALPTCLALALASLAAPAVTGQAVPGEKELLTAFGKAYAPAQAASRMAAITALGDASRELPDGGSSKPLARALGKGLADDDLEVRAAALAQFTYGRHVESTIELLRDAVTDLMAQIEKRLTRTDEESRQYVTRATRLFADGCTALSHYRDDRAAQALIPLLRGLQKNGAAGDNLSTRTVGPLATAVLALGTRDAVEAAVRQTQVYVGPGGAQNGPALVLHRALADFATSVGVAPPDYSDNVAVDWDDWFEKTRGRFPDKLGKLKDPPAAPEMMSSKDKRGRPSGGFAPRR